MCGFYRVVMVSFAGFMPGAVAVSVTLPGWRVERSMTVHVPLKRRRVFTIDH